MISTDHVKLLARYNRWQNTSLYTAADKLSDEARQQQRGAFFGSIQGTLSHLLWADQMWMSRLSGGPAPAAGSIAESKTMVGEWAVLKQQREDMDAVLVRWADEIDLEWLQEDLTWFSGASGRELVKPRWIIVTHLFNHQTHHRGQVHCLLTQCGAIPDDTDIPFMRWPAA